MGPGRLDARSSRRPTSLARAVPQPSKDATATFGGHDASYPCIVTFMAHQAEGRPTTDRPSRDPHADAPADQLEQLRFLYRIARLATTARTWDELLGTVVDETRDALHADV